QQGGAALWRREQSVQSQIRNLRYLFQPTGDCQRNPRPADRSPYGHASAAPFDLCRPASEPVTWNNRIFYVTEDVPYSCDPARRCPTVQIYHTRADRHPDSLAVRSEIA